ncbi:permease-like cell division protein FtsX [bacterium]|nr:permease-like cell division protein FtsX [bacterium]
MIKNLAYFIREGTKNIIRNSSVTVISVTLISISLFIIGVMFSIFNTVELLIDNLSSSPSLIFYIKETATITEREDLMTRLEEEQAVKRVEFLNKDDVFSKIKDDENIEDLIEIYGKDILPEAIWAFTKGSVKPDDLAAIYGRFKDHQAVESSTLQKQLSDLVMYLKNFGSAIFILFSLLVVLIVGNAIRLSVFTKDQEIYLKRLIGATETFVRFPFMVEGILKGLIGGVVADLFFLPLYLFKNSIFPPEIFSRFTLISPIQAIYMIIIGGVFGWLGSLISAKIYLK